MRSEKRAARRVLGLCVLASLAASGCFQKIKQCNALIEVTNEQQSSTALLMNAAGEPSAEQFTRIAAAIDRGNTRLAAVVLSDAQLVSLREQYRAGMVRVATAVRAAGTAMAAGNNDEASAAARNIQPAAEATTAVIDRVNSYCQGR